MDTTLEIIKELKWVIVVLVLSFTFIIIIRKRMQNLVSLKYGDKSVEFGDDKKYFENDQFKISIVNKTDDDFSNSVLSEIKDLTQNLSSINVYENKFKKKLILWRLQVLNTKVTNIKSETWRIEAQSTFSYIRYIYGSLIELLGNGDEYYSISSMRFWSKDRIFNSELYLTQNLEACKRGVVINRKILIDNTKLDTITLKELVINHEKCLERVNSETRNQFKLSFILTSDYQNQLNKYRGFGMALHREKNKKKDCIALMSANTVSIETEPEVNVFITKEGKSNYTKIILGLLNDYETISHENEEVNLEGLKKRIETSANSS